MRIVFMGTPDFAVPTLKALHESEEHAVLAVVTAIDKYIGRGKNKLRESAVKQYATAQGIPVLQPRNLKSTKFQEELKSLKADIQVVVAFRMLPVTVWDMPPLGTINLHASLLPRYRGAAPINWAIIQGELTTGLTTFRLKHEIDTGDLIHQMELSIGPDETAGELHDRMMHSGASIVMQSLETLKNPEFEATTQDRRYVSAAPKIKTSDCEINWNLPRDLVHNFVRGMSPYPGAWTTWNEKRLKILRTDNRLCPNTILPGQRLFVWQDTLLHNTGSTPICITELQLEGKKRMSSEEFLRGYRDKVEKVTD